MTQHTDLGKSLHRERVSQWTLVVSIIMLFVGLLGLAVVQGYNHVYDKAQQVSLDAVHDDLVRLCTSGAVDCSVTPDLPRPRRGVQGTSVVSVRCTNGSIVVILSTGLASKVGSCRTVPGPPGPRGPRGFRGPRGPSGFSPSATLLEHLTMQAVIRYCAHHHHCIGARGPRGPRGPRGAEGHECHGHHC